MAVFTTQPKCNDMTIFSYNSCGFSNDKVKFMKDLFEGCSSSIIAIQEHFLLRDNFYKLENAFQNYNSSFVPATKSNDSISKGRPSGGIAILWSKTLIFRSEPTKISLNSNRVQGIIFHFQNGMNLLFINVYFPVNKINFDEFELMKTLNDINWLFENNNYHEVLLAGDFNVNFLDNNNTAFATLVKDKFHTLNVRSVWTKIDIDFTYIHTQKNPDGNLHSYTNTIDHFLCNNTLHEAISDAGVLHFV